jgi:signal transduction histidine kinase
MAGAKYAALGVPSDDGKTLRAFIASGLDPEVVGRIEHEPVGKGLLGEILRGDKPIRLENIAQDPRSAGFCAHHPIMTTFLGVPIIGRNSQRLGNLYLCDRLDGRPFSEADEQLVVLFAYFAAIAIENAKLHERLQAVALRNERDRIGMELHDGIIQDIYAVGMKLEIMRGEVSFSNEAEAHFRTVLQDLNNVIDDIRRYIRDLNSADKAQVITFQQQIDNLITHFRDFSGIAVRLSVPDDLPPLTDNQRHSLAQITRESLANIARHARATQATITIRVDQHQLYLAVEDNGRGMDMSQGQNANHFGIRNMEQRARRLRGFMNIQSEPGHGTRIEVMIPLTESNST